MMPDRVPIARVLIAAPDAGHAPQRTGLRQLDHVLAARAFLSGLTGDVQLVELDAVVGMERAGAPISAGGWAEFNSLALREYALHGGLERDVPHIGSDTEGAAHAQAGNEHAIFARPAEGAEVETVHRGLGVVEFLVDGDLLLASVRLGEFGFPCEYGLTRGVQQLTGGQPVRTTAMVPVLVHTHPERDIGALIGIVRTVAGLDGMHRETARLARPVDVVDSLPGGIHAEESDRVGRTLLQR